MPEWKVYAKDKICYVLQDGKLAEAFKVGKCKGGGLITYFRVGNGNLVLTDEEQKAALDSLDSMKEIADFSGQFLYDRTRDMHFDGLARKVNEAGEIAVVETRTDKEAEISRKTAQSLLEEAKTYFAIGPSFKAKARQFALEGAKHDPGNKELNKFLQKVL
jgi:hypothetical protein